ncbi:MAG: ral secretion pathway protein GspK, partial [Variovorax sp.]|nr:ral secretion pathway protein GspK [Variovorax sp.]
RIVDAQSKLNVLNLVSGGKPLPAAVAAFTKLFTMLGLPPQELSAMIASLQRALPVQSTITNTTTTTTTTTGTATGTATATSTATTSVERSSATAPSADAPLLPQQVSQLVWLGLSSSTVKALEPYVTILPVATPININTAGPEVLFASMPKLDMAGAQRVVSLRARGPFQNPGQMTDSVSNAQIVDGQQSVTTDYFEILGKLRLDRTWVEERSLVQRKGMDVTILWRERGAGTTISPLRP